jgi:hypothetical protein
LKLLDYFVNFVDFYNIWHFFAYFLPKLQLLPLLILQMPFYCFLYQILNFLIIFLCRNTFLCAFIKTGFLIVFLLIIWICHSVELLFADKIISNVVNHIFHIFWQPFALDLYSFQFLFNCQKVNCSGFLHIFLDILHYFAHL